MEEKIDFIITWVDGNDKDWQEEKRHHSPSKKEDDRNIRYRDWGILKYWFRGVEQNASWVNKIHFVTWGHIPSWLDVNNPKINIVQHKDFIPKKFLPTFNSRVIELFFHKIEGLTDKFIYFNDDMFLINKTEVTTFFKNGLPKDQFILDAVTPIDDTFNAAIFNDVKIINKHFKKKDVLKKKITKIYNYKYGKNVLKNLILSPWKEFTGFYNSHLPVPYLKSSFNEVWDLEPQILEETCKHRFRNNSNVNHFLIRYYQLVTGRFETSKGIGRYMALTDNNDGIFDTIRSSKHKVICINDADPKLNFNDTQKRLIETFEIVYPEKSSFEKRNFEI